MKLTRTILASAALLQASAATAPSARAQTFPALAPSTAPLPASPALDTVTDRRTRLSGNLDDITRRLTAARRSYSEALRSGNTADTDRWNREVTNLEEEQLKLQAHAQDVDSTLSRARSVELSTTARPLVTSEFRSTEPVMARLQLRTAQEELERLEQARQSDTALARRGPRLEAESPARAQLRTMQAEAARLDEAAAATTRALATSSNPAEIQQELDRLNTKKAQLEQDLDRWRGEVETWESKYRQLKEELARMEQDNQPRSQLATIQGELAKITADIAAAQQALQSARAVTLARPPESFPATRFPDATFGARGQDTTYSPRGQETFSARGQEAPYYSPGASGSSGQTGSSGQRSITRRPSSFMPGEDDYDPRDPRMSRRISSRPSVQSQREMELAQEKKDRLVRDIDRLQNRRIQANRDLAIAQRVGNQIETDKATREAASFDDQLRNAQTELTRLEDDLQTKLRGIQRTTIEPSPNDPIQPQDQLIVSVAEDDTLSGVFAVRGAGIVLPRVGRVAVTGKTIAEAEQLIKQALEASQLRIATVTVDRTRPDSMTDVDLSPGGFRSYDPNDLYPQPPPPDKPWDVIYLSGEFNLPGPLRIPPGISPTLLTIVLRSGGLTPSADLQRVRLIRFDGQPQGKVEEFNIQQILQGGTPIDVPLKKDDIIFVPGYTPVVYVTGNVTRPGALRLFQDEPITAYSAILRSGGFSRFANTKKVRVVRDLGNGEKASIPINIKDIQEGRQPDVVLQGRDVVFVPEAFFSF